MHYLMMISNNSDMIIRAEFLMRSIRYFSVGRVVYFSIVVNGVDFSEFPLNFSGNDLKRFVIDNDYIMSNAEVFSSRYHWSIPVPSRWFIEPKCDTCVFVDVDMLACGDLKPLYDLDKNYVHGVVAADIHLTEGEWGMIGCSRRDLRHYFNFGMLVIPSEYVLPIGERMLYNCDRVYKMFSGRRYFSGQVSLCLTLKDLEIPLSALGRRFNWYDFLPSDNINDVIFLHYMSNQKRVRSVLDIFSIHGDIYKNKIRNTCRKVYLKI